MPARTRTTFKKHQKELARMEKQRDKAAKRAQRKLAPPAPLDADTAIAEELGPGEEAVSATTE